MNADAAVRAVSFAIWHGKPTADSERRGRDQLELLFVECGCAIISIGTTAVTLRSGGMGVFWALAPHCIVESQAETLVCKVALPTRDYLQWQLPRAFSRHLLAGGVVVDTEMMNSELDRLLFQRWLSEFEDTSAEGRKILLLEIEARLLRLARSAKLPEDETSCAVRRARGPRETDRALAMGRFIAEHYTESMHDADIAHAAKLNVQYGIRLFSRTFGVSMHKHLNDYRIAHACTLLATTDRKVIDVAMDSGFGSLSRFYESFHRACGQSPHEYRAAAGPR